MQNVHALAAITLQSCQYFAMTLKEQIFELHNVGTTQKIKDPADNTQ